MKTYRLPSLARILFALVLVLGLLLCVYRGRKASSSVNAEPAAEPHQQTLTPRAYLPLVMRDYNPDMKRWSGVHLGNRNSDWNSLFMQRIDPDQGGKWPRAAVVLSNQVYQIHRNPTSCRVESASAINPNSVIYNYVKRAALAGVKIIVRIQPSPGNFEDWDALGEEDGHHLSSGAPVGGSYCEWEAYRSPDDLSDEMGAIHSFNVSQGFSEFGFEPANEPNLEWYPEGVSPFHNMSVAWQEMDAYFSAVYDHVHANHPGVRVFTPPMSPVLYAEGIYITDVDFPELCEDQLLDNGQKGYEMMRTVYETKNDGVNWHNYWRQFKEAYSACPNGQHVSYYFPWWMKNAIRNGDKPVIISEADLASDQQGYGNPLTSKLGWTNGTLAAESIQHFFSSEWEFGHGSHYEGGSFAIASWLLTDDTGNSEHLWHVAYEDVPSERWWFKFWYHDEPEEWP